MKQHLILSLYDLTEHAQQYMKRHGISYEKAVATPITDSWTFFNCSNVPDPLPDDLMVMKKDAFAWVGRGLSHEDAEALERSRGSVSAE